MRDTAKIPSPAISFVGRHNSGKTTLIEKIIAEMSRRHFDVGTIKHHTHGDFDIDVEGKDSWRHKKAGATDVVIASPCKIARVSDIDEEVECSEIIDSMLGHDIIIIEGYRQSGIPYIEVMRKDNPRDVEFAKEFEALHAPRSIRALRSQGSLSNIALNSERPVAVVSDIEEVANACDKSGIKVFDFEEVSDICNFIQKSFVRKTVSLVIQAGGESKRMGFPKEELVFEGKHVIEAQIERFEKYVDEVVITSNHPERLEFLGHGSHSVPVRVFKDIPPRQGALTGMHTAFEKSSCERVCCIACDMFFASEHLFASQVKLMNLGDYDIVIPANKHGLEPFHALYNREKCLKAVKSALSRGEKKVVSFLEDENLYAYEMNQEEVRMSVPRGGCFVNVNTPEDLARFSG